MSTKYGTNYFPSIRAALNYYVKNIDSLTVASDIVQKIKDGEIIIGRPKTNKGEDCYLIDGRYFVE